jgi:CheY-like chemotaxis protein
VAVGSITVPALAGTLRPFFEPQEWLANVRKGEVRRVLPSSEAPQHRSIRASQPRAVLLYIEDDDENWDVAEYRLADTYDMVRARNAEEACAVLRERGSQLHAILMDIELRGSELNGIQLTELFRGKSLRAMLPRYAANLPTVTRPIIFVTAHGARYTDVELMLFGADSVIAKPVDFAALQLALSALAAKRFGVRP